jgi:hypothetical protein
MLMVVNINHSKFGYSSLPLSNCIDLRDKKALASCGYRVDQFYIIVCAGMY